MKSTIITLRLTPDEVAMLDHVRGGETTYNRSEKLRQLLQREYLRRTTGRSVVPDGAFASDFRTGRPKLASAAAVAAPDAPPHVDQASETTIGY